MKALARTLGAGFLCLMLAGSAIGQDVLALRVQRDITFARGLATDWGFIGLAEEILDDLLKIEKLDESLHNQVRLAKCDLGLVGARIQPDMKRKRAIFKEALDGILQIVDRFQRDREMGTQARILYVQGALSFGQVLQALLEEATDPDERKKLLEEAETIYSKGISFANDARAFLEPKRRTDSDARTNFFLVWMIQGELNKNWAMVATAADRRVRLNQAKRTLEEFIFAVGEETPPGQRGLLLLGQCFEIEGNQEQAITTYMDVINNIWKETLRNEAMEIPPTSVPHLTRLLEEAYYRLIKINNAKGDYERSNAFGTELVSRIEELRTEIRDLQHSQPQGMQALVEFARALWGAGQVDRAIRIANDVANQAGASVAGIEAKSLIRRILEDPTVAAKVDPGILFQGADAAFREESYEIAIRDAKKVLRALKEPSQVRDYGLRTYDLIGRSFSELGRHIEAAYAYGWGCQLFGDLGAADPAYVGQVSIIASRAQSAAQRAFSQARQDPGLQPLVDYARNIIVRFGAGEGDALIFREATDLARDGAILMREGKTSEAQAKFQEALARLRQIASDQSEWYERKLAFEGKVHFDMGDLTASEKMLRAFLENLERARPVPPESRLGSNREIARAQTLFTLGEIAYRLALGDESGVLDRTQLAEVIRIFTPFPEKFQSQTDMVTFALYYLGRAWVAKGDMDQARDYHRKLKEFRKRAPQIPRLALAIFLEFQERVKTLKEDPTATPARVETALRQALAYLDEYIEGNPMPQYAAMWAAFEYAIELGDDARVLHISDEIRRIHWKENQARIIRLVNPRTVEALLRMREFKRAEALVEEMLNSYPKGRWPHSVMWLAARTYGGWLELKNGEVIEVLGLNQPTRVMTEPFDLMSALYRTVQSPESHFTFDWYEILCQYTFLCYRAGIKESQYFERARTFIRIAKGVANFAGVQTAVPLSRTEADEQEEALSASDRKARETDLEQRRQELFQFFLYLDHKLGGRN